MNIHVGYVVKLLDHSLTANSCNNTNFINLTKSFQRQENTSAFICSQPGNYEKMIDELQAIEKQNSFVQHGMKSVHPNRFGKKGIIASMISGMGFPFLFKDTMPRLGSLNSNIRPHWNYLIMWKAGLPVNHSTKGYCISKAGLERYG